MILRGPKCAKKKILTPLHHQHLQQPGHNTHSKLGPWICAVDAKFRPYHLLSQWKLKFIKAGNVFSSLGTVQLRWAIIGCGVQYYTILNNILVEPAMVFWNTFLLTTACLFEFSLPFCHVKECGHSPLTCQRRMACWWTRHFWLPNFCSLDVFLFFTPF